MNFSLNLSRALPLVLVAGFFLLGSATPPGEDPFCEYGTADTTACSCTCPSNMVFDGYADCMCDYENVTCPSYFMEPDPSMGCGCNCFADPEDIDFFNAWCAARGATWDQASCTCKCNVSAKYFDSSALLCRCSASTCTGNLTQKPSDCSCQCPTDGASQCGNSGGTFEATSCSCSACPSNKKIAGLKCVCSTPCTAPKLQDSGTCECACPAGYLGACNRSGGTYNAEACSCACPPNKVADNQRQCVCDPNFRCQLPAVKNSTTCACECPASTVSGCTAAGGTVTTSCGCNCPSGKSWDAESKTCKCSQPPEFNPNTETWNSITCSVSCQGGFTTFYGNCVENNCAMEQCREYINSSTGGCAGCPK